MKSIYHHDITKSTLEKHFSPAALKTIINANLNQDRIFGQIGHPHFHFDDCAFEAGRDYIARQRCIIQRIFALPETIRETELQDSWKAFGRLTHAAQDFYAHSNYLALWLSQFPDANWPEPDQVNVTDEQYINHPDLVSGMVYPLEILTFLFPKQKDRICRSLPKDAHYFRNLDTPEKGRLFDYAFTAAKLRTEIEFQKTLALLSDTAKRVFTDQ
jgi:hypothetical protein